MLSPSEMNQRYQEIVHAPISSVDSECGESISNLCNTDWIQILVVRNLDSPNICNIEIEISMPTCVVEPSLTLPQPLREKARTHIENTINHLKYLLNLESVGMTLGVLSAEGIWSAVLEMKDSPDDTLFEKISPPVVI